MDVPYYVLPNFPLRLLISDVRWLSAGQALKRLFKHRKPVQKIIKERATAKVKKAIKMLKLVSQNNFWQNVAYLSDVTGHLNRSNKKLQGAERNSFDVRSIFKNLQNCRG